MTKVKICGITNIEDALKAAELGADALGFIFAHSPRQVKPKDIKEIVQKLPTNVIKIGVFVDADLERVKEIVKDCRLDALQLHGKETASYCDAIKRFSSAEIIKTFHLGQEKDLKEISGYNIGIICLDSQFAGKMGGTGKLCNWNLARQAKGLGKRIILSGGLNLDNLQKAIEEVNPWMVDVCSGVEEKARKKSWQLMKDFVSIAKEKVKNVE
ncbi:MAG: phosphoribosylanthranilate isomerase [Candidatus Omnitrophica bacterium]|nr:phosphoribosylanthranilate isomerase [Candidatus Omnitrophota bacterium]